MRDGLEFFGVAAGPRLAAAGDAYMALEAASRGSDPEAHAKALDNYMETYRATMRELEIST